MDNKKNDIINHLIDKFDFEKVHKVMVVLDWKWVNCDAVPDIKKMKEHVRSLFNDLYIKKNLMYVQCGGFKLSKEKEDDIDIFILEFIVTESLYFNEEFD